MAALPEGYREKIGLRAPDPIVLRGSRAVISSVAQSARFLRDALGATATPASTWCVEMTKRDARRYFSV